MYVSVPCGAMGAVVFLVPAVVSHETVNLFRALAAAAERGEIIGAAVSCDYPGPGNNFALHVVGASKADPTHTRGALCQFDDELSKLKQR